VARMQPFPRILSTQLGDLLFNRCQSLLQALSIAGIFCGVNLLLNAAARKFQALLARFSFPLFLRQTALGFRPGPGIILLRLNRFTFPTARHN
jgi:hypothetical protein